jgi:hypothetical protein
VSQFAQARIPDHEAAQSELCPKGADHRAEEHRRRAFVLRRIKRHIVRRIDPDMPPAELTMIDGEIDAQVGAELNPSAMPTDFGNPERDINLLPEGSDQEA